MVKILIALSSTVLFFYSAVAQSSTAQQVAATTANPVAVVHSGVVHIASIRSQSIPNGSLVTISSDEALSDYGAYRNGNSFMVLIPQAELALTEINVKGSGFTESKVEARGTNLAFSFRLAGASPSVRQDANRLEVTFTKAGGRDSTVKTEAPNVSSTFNANTPPNESANAVRSNAGNATEPTAPVGDVPAPAPNPDESIKQRDVDLTVPESPAFTVLGVTPETVTRPTTAREFATSLLNGVDQRGNFQTGLAMDFVPFLTFFGDQTSLFSYKNSRMERFLARTQLSFGTTKGVTEEDRATRLALGLRLTLWDKGDPRLDDVLEKCYQTTLAALTLSPGTHPGEGDAEKAERLAKRKQLLADLTKGCDDDARKRNWNASGWIVGAAPSWISKTGETKNFVWNGGGFWTSVAYGFDNVSALKDNSQFIFHARYRNNEVVPDNDNKGKFFPQDSLFLGGRLRMSPGGAAKSIFSLEGNFVRSRRNKGAFDNSSRFSLGFEQRLADNIWFSLSLGGQGGRKDGANQAFVLTSFKWGFAQKKPIGQ
jgi:hypothetical protein